MHFGSKYAYLGIDLEDQEEVKVDEEEGIVLSNSDVSDDDGKSCLLDICDTAGQEECSSLKDKYVKEGNGFVIIYSITDSESFKEADTIFKWLKPLKEILVANKQDLTDEAVVTQAEGKDLVTLLNIPFYEMSAKTGQGVTDEMHGLVRIIPRTGSDYKDKQRPRGLTTVCMKGNGLKKAGQDVFEIVVELQQRPSHEQTKPGC